ncbi:MAG: SMC-Scp complex subunit ScpB, partial [Pseudomonadota bacterium]
MSNPPVSKSPVSKSADSRSDDNILPFPAVNEEAGEAAFAASLANIRMVEAIVFASAEPVPEKALRARLPDDVDLREVLDYVRESYANRGVNFVRIGDAWAFRTADDLSFLLQREAVETK